MSISTYAQLKAAVSDFLNREDLTAVVPTFIALCEAGLNRNLRHWRMEARAVTALNEPFELLPTDWVETIRFSVVGGGEIKLVGPSEMMDMKSRQEPAGAPRFFSITAGQIELHPEPTTQEGELVYYSKIPALSDAEPTNWLLEIAPDLYLYGSLMHSAPYLKDDPRLGVWGQLYGAALEELNNESKRARLSGPLRMRMT